MAKKKPPVGGPSSGEDLRKALGAAAVPDPMGDLRKALEVPDPVRDLRKALGAAAVPNPLADLRQALGAAAVPNPLADLRQALGAAAVPTPMADLRKTLGLSEQPTPIADIRKSLGLPEQPTPIADLRKALGLSEQPTRIADLRKALGLAAEPTSLDDLRKAFRAAAEPAPVADLRRTLGAVEDGEWMADFKKAMGEPSTLDELLKQLDEPSTEPFYENVLANLDARYPRAATLAKEQPAAITSPAEKRPVSPDDIGAAGNPTQTQPKNLHEGQDPRIVALQADAAKHAEELRSELDKANADRTRLKALVVEMEASYEALDRLALLQNRVHPLVHAAVSDEIVSRFRSEAAQAMYVMSVDIRRSTELMLKAKTPQGFASFITQLCNELVGIVFDHYGVVDKFTGDGILCYFPLFLSGGGAGLNAVAAASRCHDAFKRHYSKSRSRFEVVPLDVGLGIGIDFGECHFVEVRKDLTIMGRPVVYACRFGGGAAGSTLLNHSARDAILEAHSGALNLTETSIDIKHEAPSLAYSAVLVDPLVVPARPEWLAAVGTSAPVGETSRA